MRRRRPTLGIEPGEGRVLAAGAAALFLVEWASVSVANVSDTLFLKRVGVELLPFVFLVNSCLLAGTTFAVGRLAVRIDHRRLLTRTLAALGLALVPLWLLVLGDVTSAFALLVIAAKQMDAIAVLAFWTAAGGLVSGRQGKRLFGPIAAGGTLGMMCGSFSSGPIGRALGIASLLPVAAALLTLAALATLALGRRVPASLHRPARRPGVEDDPTRRVRPLWREGWLFRVLALAALCAGALGPMLYFQFAYVADLATQGAGGEQRLLDLFARLRGWISVGVLAIQLAGTSALFRRLGVPLAAALSPVIYLLGLAGLSLRLSLPAGIAALAGASLQDHAVYDPAQRILVTLFPERVRAAVTTLIEGPVKRAGAVLGNLVILGALALGSPIWVGRAGLPIAGLWLGLALVLWRLYPSLLLEVASRRRAAADSTLPLAELLDAGTVRVLEQSLAGPDAERCRAACELVVAAPPAHAIGALARAARAAPPAHRPLLVETLGRLLADPSAAPVASPEAGRDLAALAAEPAGLDALGRATLVRACVRLLGPAAAGGAGRTLLARAAADESEAVRLAGAAARLRAGLAPAAAGDLDAVLAAALGSADPATRRVACEELRAELLRDDAVDERWPARLALLLARLEHADDRPHAAAALADVSARHGAALEPYAPAMLARRADPDARVRSAVLRFAGNLGLAGQARWLAERLAADDPDEAAAARYALRTLGPAAADALLHTLRFGRLSARDAALPILLGLRLDPAGAWALADRELDTIRRLLVQADALGAGAVSSLVLQRLRERVDESVHTALLLLAAALDDERIARLGRLLGRARSVRDRAVLLEALEALLPPRERQRLLPLLEDRSPQALARTAAHALGRPLPSFEEALADALATEDPLTCALIASTLEPAALARHAPSLDSVAAARLLVPRRAGAAAGAGDGAGVDRGPAAVPYEAEGSVMLSGVETMLHLRSLDLFEGLTTQQLAELASVVEEVAFPAGAAIVREGEFDDRMYLIVTGRVRISKEGQSIADLGPHEFFGEMAVFDGETRSATVTAVAPARLLRLARHDLFQVMEERPAIAIALCQTLTRRLRNLLDQRAGRAEAKGPPGRDAG